MEARGAKSGWLEIMSGMEILSWPIDWRNSKSLRQWPIFETMIRTRGLSATELSEKSMERSEAVAPKEERREDGSTGEVEDEVEAKCTRMKNFLVEGSPNCCESTMFRLCWARKPVTAWTMPGRSGQESVRMYSSALAIVMSGGSCSRGEMCEGKGKVRLGLSHEIL